MIKNEEDSLLHMKYSYVQVDYEILDFDKKKENSQSKLMKETNNLITIN